MKWQTSVPAVVTDHGPWQKDKPEFGEFVELADTDEFERLGEKADKFRYSLGVDHEFDVPPIGTPVVVAIDTFIRQEPRISPRTNRQYIADLEKRRVTFLKAA